jgi:hypothetical protein
MRTLILKRIHDIILKSNIKGAELKWIMEIIEEQLQYNKNWCDRNRYWKQMQKEKKK